MVEPAALYDRRMGRLALVTAIAFAFGAAACDSSVSGGTGGSSGSNGTGGSGGTNGTGGTGGSGGDGGINCGVQTFMLDRLPPDLLIVLDKSGSMNDAAPSGTGSKWVQVTAAIDTSVNQLQSQIRFGLTFFAASGACGVTMGTPPVAIAANNYTAIHNAIAGKSPGGSTPTRTAMQAAGSYMA